METSSILRRYKKDNALQNTILEYTLFLDVYAPSIKQRVYHYVNKIDYPSLCLCNKSKKFKNCCEGYRKSCGDNSCSKKIREITCIEKYGVKNVAGNINIQEKIHATNIKRYGTKGFNIAKQKETIFEKYGVEFVSQIKDVKEKKKKTFIEKYGFDHPSKNKEIAIKISNSHLNSIKKKEYFVNKRLLDLNNVVLLNKDIFLSVSDDLYTFIFKCLKCEQCYEITRHLIRQRKDCTACTKCNIIGFNHTSEKQIKIMEFLKTNGVDDMLINCRNVISGELDIYIPSLNIAIEFNGLYWHNELRKSNTYHLDKTIKCNDKGIRLIHIWEDDFDFKLDIIKSMLLNYINKTSLKIHGRKCEIKEVNSTNANIFLNDNHIQGNVNASIKIGLYHNDELVSLMTFGMLRKSLGQKSEEGHFELLRFCNKLNTTVIGGASKLFKYFLKTYKPKKIISYADRSRSIGNLYEKLGFIKDKSSGPNYWYVVDGIRKHRFGYRKDILVKQGYDVNKTEKEIMFNKNIYRIYDCGNLKYVFNI
jgi:predicted DNA binding CopG/RHH family protein